MGIIYNKLNIGGLATYTERSWVYEDKYYR
jgi:hypothetical protein